MPVCPTVLIYNVVVGGYIEVDQDGRIRSSMGVSVPGHRCRGNVIVAVLRGRVPSSLVSVSSAVVRIPYFFLLSFSY